MLKRKQYFALVISNRPDKRGLNVFVWSCRSAVVVFSTWGPWLAFNWPTTVKWHNSTKEYCYNAEFNLHKYTIFDLLDLFFILELLDFEFFTYILLCLCVKVALECLISRGRLNGTPGRSRKVRSLFFCLCIYLSSLRTDVRFPSNCDSSVPLAQTSNQSIARQQCNGFKPVGWHEQIEAKNFICFISSGAPRETGSCNNWKTLKMNWERPGFIPTGDLVV